MVILLVPFSVTAATDKVQQIGGVIIPQAFSQALQDGMSIPLFIHLEGSTGTQDDQRIGNAFIWLDNGVLRVRQIQLEENDNNATVSEQTRKQLTALANEAFSKDLNISLTDDARLQLSLRQLLLQLVVKKEALGTVLRSRSEDIGQSSVNTLSSTLNYNLGVYNNQMRNGGNNTSRCASTTWCWTARFTVLAPAIRTATSIKRCMNATLPVTALRAGCWIPGIYSPLAR